MVAKKNQKKGKLTGPATEVIRTEGRVNPDKPSEPTNEPENEPRKTKKKSSKKKARASSSSED